MINSVKCRRRRGWAESREVPLALATRRLDRKQWSVAHRGVVRNKASATYKLCKPEQVP